MSIFKIGKDQLEYFTVVANPFQNFVSSSSGATGSVYVFPRRSSSEKDLDGSSAFQDSTSDDSSLDSILRNATKSNSSNIYKKMDGYLSSVNSRSSSNRKQRSLEILRFVPSFTYTSDTATKILIKDKIMPFYRPVRPSNQWGYTNYHSLNFFTGSKVPSNSALLYPNVIDGSNYASSSYNVTGAFTFEMYLNPRYTTDLAESLSSFRAGTILHLSSTYALSLVTGTLKDEKGYPSGFRLLLQLSSSAEILPSLAVPASNNLVFLSSDNSLKRNHWHHVVVRWGTSSVNSGTGSFIVDGNSAGTFVVPSASIALPGTLTDYPDVLSLGNFYEGPNSGLSAQSLFFSQDVSTRDGLELLDGTTGVDFPASYNFSHPLNAEIHDVSIRNSYLNDYQINSTKGKGISDFGNVIFYVPPFFTKASPRRTSVGSYGGVPMTPFYTRDDTTEDPFNVDLSFGVGGHYLNLENFCMDFATGKFPRLLNLTASTSSGTSILQSANDYLYSQPSVVKRNLTILPCDDGNFLPNFLLLHTFMSGNETQEDVVGYRDPSFISLENMLNGVITYNALSTVDSGSLFDDMLGPSPEKVNIRPKNSQTRERGLSIYQRTRDDSSNEVVMFDISNLFYGSKIMPGSFTMSDTNLTGSDSKISIRLKDNGFGSLYRADSETPHATWSSIGNVLYEDGFALVKTPEIPFFGINGYELDFRGEQEVHVFKANVLALPSTLNSSSNPTYSLMSASFSPDDDDQKFVYITNINLHDENLNVVMKAQLAQPIIKKARSKILFRLRYDW